MTTRSERMTLLAASDPAELDKHWKEFDRHPSLKWTRRPQVGAIAVRGRASRTGSLFELGEMTVTRCSVEVDGVRGYSYVAGRNKRHAALAAVFDALAESDGLNRSQIERILADLQAKLDRRRAGKIARANTSVVDLQE
ncbi:phosphonate C-P lyase system protein PhnG [Phyllobacterium sophorae]|uniref:Phosphonate C-P lyase system protein PhnG n=1 Tax=Phyllobacterium sophorae TaxID=1520277 RepID=A0A2P7AQT7_9HYPH|nr:phosphonate C-P lyase system protein PhnG [Phyllobacterium sophorae]PSH56497.1 phosphonate C-P lyase system protein PhnG [Phyllobacterium sophorae]